MWRNMERNNNAQRDSLHLLFWFVFGIAFVALLFGLSSCKTQKQSLVEHTYIQNDSSLYAMRSRLDSLWHSNFRKDSVIIKDSIVTFIKGDTITIDRWHTEYRDRSITDTLVRTIEVHDTIMQTRDRYILKEVEKEVIQEVNRLYWWQKALMWIGGIGLLGIVGLVILFIYKLKKHSML